MIAAKDDCCHGFGNLTDVRDNNRLHLATYPPTSVLGYYLWVLFHNIIVPV